MDDPAGLGAYYATEDRLAIPFGDAPTGLELPGSTAALVLPVPPAAPTGDLMPAPPAPPAEIARARWAAGVTVALAAVGTGIGALVGGGWGAAAGLFLSGGVANAVRAQRLWRAPAEADRTEALRSGTAAVFGLGVGAYFAYRAHGRATPKVTSHG